LCFSCKNCRNSHTCKCRHSMVCLKILKTCISSNPVTFRAVKKHRTGANQSPGFSGYLLYVPAAALSPRSLPATSDFPDKVFHFLKIAQNHRALASSTGRDGQLTGRLERHVPAPVAVLRAGLQQHRENRIFFSSEAAF